MGLRVHPHTLTGHITLSDGRHMPAIMCADGGLVPDPRHLLGPIEGLCEQRNTPLRYRSRTAAVLSNRGAMASTKSADPINLIGWEREPCWIIGNGPSAASQRLGPGNRVVINGAMNLLRHAHIWLVADPLCAQEVPDLRQWRQLLPRADVLAACHWTAPALTVAADHVLWWLPICGGPYGAPFEELLEEEITAQCMRLLMLSEGASAALHLAYRLGAREIHLIGLEHCRADNEPWHAGGSAPAQERGSMEVQTPHGKRLTTEAALAAHAQLDAMCYWIGQDARIYDHSRGIRYQWAGGIR